MGTFYCLWSLVRCLKFILIMDKILIKWKYETIHTTTHCCHSWGIKFTALVDEIKSLSFSTLLWKFEFMNETIFFKQKLEMFGGFYIFPTKLPHFYQWKSHPFSFIFKDSLIYIISSSKITTASSSPFLRIFHLFPSCFVFSVPISCQIEQTWSLHHLSGRRCGGHRK